MIKNNLKHKKQSTKYSKEKVLEAENRFRTLFENANDAIWLMRKNVFIDCNRKTVEIFKCKSKKDMINHTPMDFSPVKQPDGQNSKTKALKYIKAAFSNKPQRFYWKHQDKYKRPLDMEISLNKIVLNNEKYLQAIGRDVSENKKYEEKLKESETRFRNIFEYSAVGVSLVSTTGRWLEVNDALCKITGYSKKELLSNDFNDITFVDDRSKSLGIIKKIISGEKNHAQFEKRYINKNGQIVWVNISTALVRDPLGKPLYFVTHTEDITSLKELEQAKNEFLSMASHQLRTPLSATKWVLESMNSDQNFTIKQKEKIQNLIISNEKLINLVTDLLDVTKIESGKLVVNKKITDVKKMIDATCLAVKDLAENKKKIIKIIVPSKLKNIHCDPFLISEALKNLLINAINYGEENSRFIKIKVTDRVKDYLISVHNNGIINPSSLKRIQKFEKFTRGVDASNRQPAGTGLGLYIIKSIIEASGGTVWFKSDTKSGTTFYLTVVK
ncbi:MAG: PAS domain S-box protein [Minisyncoccia bacterium]